MKKADYYYDNHSYDNAIVLLQREVQKDPGNLHIILKLANSYFFNNDMRNAVYWYNEFENNYGQFDRQDELYFATALQSSGLYSQAIPRLDSYQKNNQDGDEISEKIWQLQNIQYLLEDSIYFEISNLKCNTEDDEIGPALFGDQLVFSSNRNEFSIIKRIDASTGKSYFSWYSSALEKTESEIEDKKTRDRLNRFAPEIKSRYHMVGISFNKEQDLMVYAKITGNTQNQGTSSKIFFAKKIVNKWIETNSYPYNSESYSISNPAFALQGKRLYFSSDMPGGNGGTDLYYSDLIDGKWSQPANLGEVINSKKNESHPFVYEDKLYFSSDGHPGLGGLDIFYVELEERPLKVINHGYPANTYHDDFGLILDENGSTGYFSSNRDQLKNQGDDIYRIEYKKLTFPININGIISFKKYEIESDRTILVKLSNARIELIDKNNNEVLQVSKTDSFGNFNIEIPYESKFLLRVIEKKLGTAVVSMEIPKNHRDYLNHDIVIVQDLFNSTDTRNMSTDSQ